MNLPLVRSSSYLWRHSHRFLRVQLVLSPNSLSASFSSSSPSSTLNDSLQKRILEARDSSISTVSVIEQWLAEGKKIKLFKLRQIVNKLRNSRRFSEALKISDLLTDRDQWSDKLLNIDVAVRLELIAKVHGLEEAETFFNSLSGSSLNHHVYGALLNCYAHAKEVEKAEATMQKMKDSGFMETADFYNLMLSLYSQIGNYEKLDMLMLEMEKRGIKRNLFTYTIRLQAYVACSDIEGMEKLLGVMAADPGTKMDFHFCISAANGYLKAGLVEKTLTMLEKSELLIVGSRKSSYEVLFTLYAAIGRKDELYRLWDLYKQIGESGNWGYICMISSLVKSNDIDGAEKIWEEWNSEKSNFDIRIPNLLIGAYSQKGYLEKAEAFIDKLVESGEEPDSTSWDHLAVGYLLRSEMGKVVEMVKKAITSSKPGRQPALRTLLECFKYLKDQGDKEAVDEFVKMINENCHFSPSSLRKWSSCVEDGHGNTETYMDTEPKNATKVESPCNIVL